MVAIETFMERVLNDEVWMAPLPEGAIAYLIALLEARFPPDAELSDDEAARLHRALRRIAVQAEAGDLDEDAIRSRGPALLET